MTAPSLMKCLVLGLSMAVSSSAWAEYQVYQWANFEDGRLPTGSIPYGVDVQNRLTVVDFGQLADVPAEFRSSAAASETGRFGLRLHTEPQSYIVGLAAGVLLDRDRLGDHGTALYQADFFLPGSNVVLPSLAVMAMEPPAAGGDGKPRTFYRFGITKGTSLYFSNLVYGEQHARVYLNDPAFLAQIPRPGWHRFAIAFEGARTIRCFVDGREPSFSPLQEETLRKLQVGIMLADQDQSYDCYVDNLSIQLAMENAPVPDSPYNEGWSIPARGKEGGAVSTTPVGGGMPAALPWMEPTAAWAEAVRAKKPMIIYFESPHTPNTDRLNQTFESNGDARAFLKKYLISKLDINQLQGGTIAGQYGVFRAPTIIVFSPEGKEVARATLGKNESWEAFAARLASPK